MPKVPRSGYIRIASVEPCDVESEAGRRAAMTWDLSVGGVYVVIDPLPAIDERIHLSFRLPNDPEPIHAEGRMAWRNPPSKVKGMALKTIALRTVASPSRTARGRLSRPRPAWLHERTKRGGEPKPATP